MSISGSGNLASGPARPNTICPLSWHSLRLEPDMMGHWCCCWSLAQVCHVCLSFSTQGIAIDLTPFPPSISSFAKGCRILALTTGAVSPLGKWCPFNLVYPGEIRPGTRKQQEMLVTNNNITYTCGHCGRGLLSQCAFRPSLPSPLGRTAVCWSVRAPQLRGPVMSPSPLLVHADGHWPRRAGAV